VPTGSQYCFICLSRPSYTFFVVTVKPFHGTSFSIFTIASEWLGRLWVSECRLRPNCCGNPNVACFGTLLRRGFVGVRVFPHGECGGESRSLRELGARERGMKGGVFTRKRREDCRSEIAGGKSKGCICVYRSERGYIRNILLIYAKYIAKSIAYISFDVYLLYRKGGAL
jgi:hypothetical protein